MCMEDVRLGRETGSGETRAVIGATLTPIIGPSDDRITLLISSPETGTAFYTSNPGNAADQGIPLTSGAAPLILNIKDHGSIVRKGWFASRAAGATACTVIEGLLPKQ